MGDKGRARVDLKSQKICTRGVGQSSAALQADEEAAVASVDRAEEIGVQQADCPKVLRSLEQLVAHVVEQYVVLWGEEAGHVLEDDSFVLGRRDSIE